MKLAHYFSCLIESANFYSVTIATYRTERALSKGVFKKCPDVASKEHERTE